MRDNQVAIAKVEERPMANELVCPNCHVSLDERRLIINTMTVESCPNCRAMVRKQEGFQWRNRDALLLEDVSGIEEWLDVAARVMGLDLVRQTGEQGKDSYIWDISNLRILIPAFPWSCTAVYTPDIPNIVELRLTSKESDEIVPEDPQWLQTVCADHGLQPHASQETTSDWGGTRIEMTWGCRQFLATSTLSQDLLAAVIKRLDTAMRDASTHLARRRRAKSGNGSR